MCVRASPTRCGCRLSPPRRRRRCGHLSPLILRRRHHCGHLYSRCRRCGHLSRRLRRGHPRRLRRRRRCGTPSPLRELLLKPYCTRLLIRLYTCATYTCAGLTDSDNGLEALVRSRFLERRAFASALDRGDPAHSAARDDGATTVRAFSVRRGWDRLLVRLNRLKTCNTRRLTLQSPLSIHLFCRESTLAECYCAESAKSE